MVKRSGWLTPNDGATEYLCRPLNIPLDDEMRFVAAVSGALLDLTYARNWEQFGDMTPEQAAEVMFGVYTEYTEGVCSDVCVCTIPPAFGIDVGIELRIIRRNSEGFYEELVDGEWVEPTGEYETPEPAPREESTEAERLCAAAANAAAVMEQFYEEATDAFIEFGTATAVAEALLDVIVLVLGAFGQVQAASNISFGASIFQTFTDVFSLITGDVWDAAFTDELTCVLLDNASEVSSVVSFDWPGIKADLLTMSFSAGLDFDRQLLIQQLNYLLDLIAAGGLNVAGGTTAVVSPDCSDCDVWCYFFDFTTGTHGWEIRVPPDRGVYVAGVGFQSHYNEEGGTDNIAVYARLLESTVPITRIEVTYDFTGGSPNTRNMLVIEDATTLLSESPVSGTGQVIAWSGSATFSELGIQLVVSSGAAPTGGPATITGVLLRGTGANPFGDDNCV